jgi:ADP-ribose diphosphatase
MSEPPAKKPEPRKLPEVLRAEIVARTNIFRVERRDLRFSNGTEVSHERLIGSKHGAVLIVPMLDDDTVLMIREFATGVHRYELALPKGRIEVDEPLLDAANREIMEEVGYGARRLTHLTSLTVAPGYLSHETHVVLAEDLFEERKIGDEPEKIEVIPWRLDALPELLAQHDCTEARSIAALFMAQAHIAQRKSQ